MNRQDKYSKWLLLEGLFCLGNALGESYDVRGSFEHACLWTVGSGEAVSTTEKAEDPPVMP